MTRTGAPPALTILRKDLRQRLRDRSALMVAIVVPLVLASIFGLIFHNAAGGRVSFSLGLLDADHGPAAQAFEQRVLRPLERQGLISVVSEPTLQAARTAADRNRVAAVIVIPAGLSAAIAAGRPATLRVLGSVDAPVGAHVAQSITDAFAEVTNTGRVAAAAEKAAAGKVIVALAAGGPVAIANVSARSRQLDSGTFYAAGMAIFFLFFTVQFGVSSLLEERRDGTLQRILVAPIHRAEVLVGKLLTSLVLGTLSMLVLVLATHLLLGANWGNPLGVLILILAGVIAATCVMTLVATLAKTPDQAGSWQSMVALVLGMLGGAFFPVAQAGAVVATLSKGTPQAWFMRGLQNMAGGGGARVVLGPALAMLAFAAVTGALAFARIGRLIER